MNISDDEEIKETAQDLETVTIEQMSDAIEEAKKIMLLFVENQFGEESLTKVSYALNNLKIGIDRDPKIAELCGGYYGSGGVFLIEKYCRKLQNTIDLINIIIHECAHAFSGLISKGKVNTVVEEAFANLFAEMSINNYIQKGNRINYISENENEILANNNGYYKQYSYTSEGEFTRSIMYALKTKDKDKAALKEYFFGSKEEFVDICDKTLGHHLKEILTQDLANVQIYLQKDIALVENNADLYLPQASRKLINILENYFDYPLDENILKQHKKGEENEVYAIDNNLMDVICFENKLRYDWLQKIDISNVKRDNVKQIFSNLSVEDIHELSEKSNGKIKENCSRWGYSNFIRLLIRGWYEVNRDNPSNFEEIMSLTGGIPFDVFQEIMQDREITNINDIMNYIADYHVLGDTESEVGVLWLLNQKVGNEFSKEKYSKQVANDEDMMFYLSEILLKDLPKLNLSNESLQKIIYIYSTPLSQINSDNILDILDILGKFDYSQDDSNNLFWLESTISNYINAKGMITKEKINDIGLLIKIGQLPREVRKKIEEELVFDNLDLYDDVGEAISTLKKYGYEIENEDEILYHIMHSDYGNIRIVPNVNSETLLAFANERDKTEILLNACINQFLESENSMFFDDKNIDTCLMLMDDKQQDILGISDVMARRICTIIQEKMQDSSEINSERRDILDKRVNERLTELENKKRLTDYFNVVKETEQSVHETIQRFLLEKKLSKKQIEDIIKFFKCDNPREEDIEQGFFECDLKNIWNVLEACEISDISVESESYSVMGEDFLIHKLMNGAKKVRINDDNIGDLRQIYNKLKTIKGLTEEEIADNLFASDEIKTRVCSGKGLIESGVSATLNITTTSQINNQVSEILESQHQSKNDKEIDIEPFETVEHIYDTKLVKEALYYIEQGYYNRGEVSKEVISRISNTASKVLDTLKKQPITIDTEIIEKEDEARKYFGDDFIAQFEEIRKRLAEQNATLFIHGTGIEIANKVMQTGFEAKQSSITSTAIGQTSYEDKPEYDNFATLLNWPHRDYKGLVLIAMPNECLNTQGKAKPIWKYRKIDGDRYPLAREYAIKPEFIVGIIDVLKKQIIENPAYTNEHSYDGLVLDELVESINMNMQEETEYNITDRNDKMLDEINKSGYIAPESEAQSLVEDMYGIYNWILAEEELGIPIVETKGHKTPIFQYSDGTSQLERLLEVTNGLTKLATSLVTKNTNDKEIDDFIRNVRTSDIKDITEKIKRYQKNIEKNQKIEFDEEATYDGVEHEDW